MPELQWSMFVCPSCDAPALTPGHCGFHGYIGGAPGGPDGPQLMPIEVVPRSELEAAREEIASDGGSFREALVALKTVADERDRLRGALEQIGQGGMTGDYAWRFARAAITPPAEGLSHE